MIDATLRGEGIDMSEPEVIQLLAVQRPSRRLQDMVQVEANSLLNLHCSALRAVFPYVRDTDITAPPEVRHVMLLRQKQWLEPLCHDTIHRPLGATAKLLWRGGVRGMVDHELREVDRMPRPSLDPESNLTEVVVVAHGIVGWI